MLTISASMQDKVPVRAIIEEVDGDLSISEYQNIDEQPPGGATWVEVAPLDKSALVALVPAVMRIDAGTPRVDDYATMIQVILRSLRRWGGLLDMSGKPIPFGKAAASAILESNDSFLRLCYEAATVATKRWADRVERERADLGN